MTTLLTVSRYIAVILDPYVVPYEHVWDMLKRRLRQLESSRRTFGTSLRASHDDDKPFSVPEVAIHVIEDHHPLACPSRRERPTLEKTR